MPGAKNITERLPVAFRVPPIALATLAQAVSAVGAVLLTGQFASLAALLVQGLLAAIVGRLLTLPGWWVPINLGFPLLVGGVSLLRVAPEWYLGAFLLMVAVYWSTFRTQVPLYLSGRQAVALVASRLPQDRPCRLLDIGSGTGTVLAQLATRVSAAVELHGIELAPLPHAIARVRARMSRNRFAVKRQDFWQCDLSRYDVVYAFLSPVPMPALWRKVRAEMRPGSLFISNTFAVPGVPPDESVAIGGGSRVLYLWRMR
ncbi:MAG: class I SAM-dependent methyltransferase [Burkholderiales bacterium]